MSKRTAESSEYGPLKGGHRPDAMEVDDKTAEMGEFEDEFEDEYESEDEIFEAGFDGRPDAEREAEEANAMQVDGAATAASSSTPGTFMPGRTKLAPGETLAPDSSTYRMLHNLSTPWPCLSFDIVRDGLGSNRSVYPATMYLVAGTQAASSKTSDNQLMVMKFSGLSKTAGVDSDSDDDNDDEEDDEDAEPIIESRTIPLKSTTNRIRAHQTPSQDPSRPPTTVTASMTESSHVLIHDVTPHLASFDTPGAVISPQQDMPIGTIRTHKAEGYAVDWSPLHVAGRLVTGDNDGLIYQSTRIEGGGVTTDNGRPFRGHDASVEDLQWSPSEAAVFASASADGTVRVWDVRSKSRAPAISMRVSATDVNVISWSRLTHHLLATGAEDGEWAVWDLRQWKPTAGGGRGGAVGCSTPIANFHFHKEQVSSIEWHPTDDSIVAVGAGDNTVTLWDLAVELDDEESRETAGVADIPPQLLFVHYQSEAREVHWHPQIPGALVATGAELSAFRTISV